MAPESDHSPPSGWSTCESSQVEVMLLGTYHMDNPGLDAANVDADDVLTQRRQAELRELADQLAGWDPERVAVERPYDRGEDVNDLYDEYRSGQRSFDSEEEFPAPHPWRNDPTSECRSEVVQVGFRLANTLGHDHVIAIDEHPDQSRYESDPFDERQVDSERKTQASPPNLDEYQRELNERLATSTVREFLRWLNEESQLRVNHAGMFDRAIRGTASEFGSPLALAAWYDRNARMVHHLWRKMAPSDRRVLVVVGSGHVRALRHLLREAPMFCPVSPLPYL